MYLKEEITMTLHLSRISAAVAAFAAVSLALTACSGASTPSTSGDAGAPTELEHVKVGVLPNIDVAAIYLGESKGFFEEEGIDLELVQAASGSAVVPAVVSGDLDFGFSNVAALLTASQKGLPLKAVSAGVYSTGESGNDIAATVAADGSDISSIADLDGKNVAVTSLGGIFPLTIRYLSSQAGISVNLVELGAADTPAALETGQVDAAVMSEPFLSQAKADGAVEIFSNFADMKDNFMVAAYFTTADYIGKNSETVEKLQAALAKAFAYANENPEEVRAILSEYTELSDEVKANAVLPKFDTEVDIETLQLLADLLLETGQVDAAVDVNALLP